MTDDGAIECTLHELPLRAPWESRRGTTTRRWSLVVAASGDGVTGWGEAALPLRIEEPFVLAREALRLLPRLRVGDPFSAFAALDHAGVTPWLRHGVSAALLDHAARTAGRSLADHLASLLPVPRAPARSGGQENGVPVNGNLGPLAPGDAAREARRLVDAGFRTIKVKSLGDAAADARRLAAVRDTVGDEVALRLDANGAWGLAEVHDALRRLVPFGLQYVEEPLGTARVEDRVRLAGRSPVPVAWDESVSDPEVAPRLVPGAAALVVKPPRLGGVDRVLRVLAHAAAGGVPVVVSSPLEGAVGRAVDLQLAALCPIRLAHGLATGPQLAEDLAEPLLAPERGAVWLPQGPGIGPVRVTAAGTPVSGGDAGSG